MHNPDDDVTMKANASWTLKADATSRRVCNLLNHMKKNKYAQACARNTAGVATDDDFFGLDAGYLQRAKELVPKQGVAEPWVLSQNCLADLMSEPFESIEDGTLEFAKQPPASRL